VVSVANHLAGLGLHKRSCFLRGLNIKEGISLCGSEATALLTPLSQQYNSSCDSESDGLSVNASLLVCSSRNREQVAMHYGSIQRASEVTLGDF
jgi:hypothetical protein